MPHSRRNPKEAEVIDENLRRVYQDMLDEKVPDRFLDLISQLKSQDEAPAPDAAGKGEDVA
ncbi:NepR family anti-sigma factor [Salipiger marinus]|jgi:hypothetical protein|uniref:Anti-sigma factor NepR domain-containing protein n=1 Tax=Salipiger marinus TaxID=555512 RepID=A0A1G8R6U4_9RHOB|nr:MULTISPECIES: NepR family anti-sigma factor [Salipiger]HBM60754.1 hypothetical protein [Citreicella sp.]MCD1619274.1 hypothetical protein [Salipiger manganoxidans]MEB3419313.1 NepR family anti-sigma factor [Salipiger manganoxidans]SDJ12706.1 hypothetical protein SAMN04487993_10197 [Salipiger marinus]HBS99128.1 hypothetical protein [Citreicella sp.]